ncbi:cytochrome c oxidase assembly protein [Sphingomonas canadensis]|uniref:Cytochrome c oxidase assembly protein CtaG n=1 Tax=Sphingomonas canadensis TaxID=1219257 RepID=A0ABW3HAT0_9SPHN|nr:cytochrome c oxidase assembly protein [Sphingomonas canadensis]MCW3837212.1 cytochrome c oxidase assembly protein [Sphingomonas canadensis]
MTRNLRTALLGSAFVVFMGGLGFASVPLYRMFCEVTGLNGTTQRGVAAPGGTGKSIRVAFDSNTAPGLGWEFKPEQRVETIDIGARDMAFYVATNNAGKPVTGSATFNVTPVTAGKYFAKIQCFCFNQQTLKPGETVRMPVIYYVDPAILTDPDTKDIREITLSYTFYPVDSGKTAS